jgi:flagellar hook-associated protein 2
MATTATVLDVPSLVSQLMSIERKPIDKLNAKVTDFQSRISSFGTLAGLVSTFQGALTGLKSSLQGYRATSSDASIFSATAANTAVAGTYTLNISRLAQAQNLVAAGQASATTAIATSAATATFTMGGTTTSISIAAGATLENIRDSINAAKPGVTATIVNDGTGTPYRLALTASATGLTNGVSSITVSGGGTALNDLLAFDSTAPSSYTMQETVAAQDASLSVNGIAITGASNTIAGAIQGVTLSLNKTSATPVTLAVGRDTAAISSAASGFVDAYNALVTQLKSRSAYGNATAAAGALAGDGTVRQMLDQLRGIFTTPTSGGSLSYLAEVGIATQTGGTLKLDGTKLADAMTKDFADVDNLFNSATGFGTRLAAWATSVTQTGGAIDLKTKSLNSSVNDYNSQIAKLETRMTALKKQYTTTYTNLNLFLANMNSTSSYLTSQFTKG